MTGKFSRQDAKLAKKIESENLRILLGELCVLARVVLRNTPTAILIVAGGACGAVLLCMLALRLVISAVLAVSGIQSRMMRSGQVLDW